MVDSRPLWLALWLALLYHSPQGTRAAPVDPQNQGGLVWRGQVTPGHDLPREQVLQEVTRLQRLLQQEPGDESLGWSGDPGPWVTWTRRSLLSLTRLYLPDPTKVNPQCRRDLLTLYQALVDLPQLAQHGILWPAKLVDSWGKFTDGVLVGNTKALGFFSECLDVDVHRGSMPRHGLPHPGAQLPGRVDDPPRRPPSLHHQHPDPRGRAGPMESLRNVPVLEEELPDDPKEESRPGPDSSSPQSSFQGQYCLLTYHSRGDNHTEAPPPPPVRVPAMSLLHQQPLLLHLLAYATCMPSTCTHLELKSVDAELAQRDLQVGSVACQTRQERHALGATEICGVVVLTLVGVVLLVATLVDVWSRATGRLALREGDLRFLLVFSVTRNLTKIFHLETRRSSQVISCLHGIRFLSISWVVLGHQYAYSATVAQNPLDALQVTKRVGFQIIANGDLSVDTFFLMSGLLVTLGVMTQVTKRGSFNVALYYTHRVIRLLPPIATTVFAVATVSGLLVEGPVAPPYTTYYLKGCRHSWWMDVTFISNLVFPYISQMGKKDEGATCLPHCWYTSVDMQLYLVMPLLILPLYFWPRKGTVLLGVWTLASLIIPSVIVGVYHTWPSSLLVQDPEAMLEYNHKVYLMPWCRAGPYLVGVWAGYIIHRARESPTLSRLQPGQVVFGWTSAVGVALAVLFGIVRYNFAGLPSQVAHMSLVEAVVYGGLHRAAWGAAVAWVVLACHWGYGGPIDWFLSYPLWQPLSRLTYSIYLTSLPIQFMLLYSTTRTTYFSHIIKVEETCGVLFIVFLASVLLSLVSESPILALEKLVLQPSKTPVKAEEQLKEDVSPTVEREDVKVDLQDAKDDPPPPPPPLTLRVVRLSTTWWNDEGLDPTVD
ncbi:nose resistant to fluoxetine protein 6-like isoform X2 [Panulirus ornatus]|uniref:nose resistant to fluoxetine protein 6-like isoform X2 n=1 Tax=Panulirus ornatus TaxID=150431 RepID=UPI003A8A32FB